MTQENLETTDDMTAESRLCLTQEQVKEIAGAMAESILCITKEVLTIDEAARYMGAKKSYLYKLTMEKAIPHSKPLGKKCYFRRAELEQWLMSNPVPTEEQINNRAMAYCLRNRHHI